MEHRQARTLTAPTTTQQWRYRTAVQAARMLNATAPDRGRGRRVARHDRPSRDLSSGA